MLRQFVNAPPCQPKTIEAGFDAVIVRASEATPHRIGEASHAAEAPQAVRHSGHGAASDLRRWDFDQDGPLLLPHFRLAAIVQVDAHLDWREERNGLRHTFWSPMRRATDMY